MAYSAVALGHANQEFVEKVTATWNDYVNLAYNTGQTSGQVKDTREARMYAEYDMMKDLRPKMQISKTGQFQVSGLSKIYVPEDIKKK